MVKTLGLSQYGISFFVKAGENIRAQNPAAAAIES